MAQNQDHRCRQAELLRSGAKTGGHPRSPWAPTRVSGQTVKVWVQRQDWSKGLSKQGTRGTKFKEELSPGVGRSHTCPTLRAGASLKCCARTPHLVPATPGDHSITPKKARIPSFFPGASDVQSGWGSTQLENSREYATTESLGNRAGRRPPAPARHHPFSVFRSNLQS